MLRSNLRVLALCFVTAIVSACGGGGGGGGSGSTPTTPAPGVPTAQDSANALAGTAPLTVNFDASASTDPQGLTLTYTWSFGDGATATGAKVSHTYQNHGSYSATVTVSNGTNTSTATPLVIAVAPAAPSVASTALSMNVIGVAPSTVNGQVSASDREGLALTYTLASPPSAGSVTVNSATGAISYSVAGHVSASTDSFTVRVANLGASTTATVNVSLKRDPLLSNQWHIQDTGQSSFSSTLPVAGNDMNVAGAWAAGFSGKGIKVGVVDSGLDAKHEDLAANVDLTHSFNFLTALSDPTPISAGFDHGTSVSGIIGAVAFNGVGGRGVAYDARLRGYNLIAPGAQSIANMAKAMGSDPVSADNDVFNASFGKATPSLPSFSGAFQAITVNTLSMRGGLGAAISNAAGNDFKDWEGFPNTGLCDLANQFGVSCGDPANDERRGGSAPIIVGAINAEGKHSSYSSTGSSLWISAPGGEFGFDSALVPAQSADFYKPAIVTTSFTGCANAQAPIAVNSLDSLGANPLAPGCQYTALMNGTSSATPNVAGTIALMLEANPLLSVRDIKHILAKTARKVDPTFAGVSSTAILPGETIVLEPGWITNAAGWAFSNRYGFGAVDAAAATAMAKTYTTFLPAQQGSAGNYQFVAAPPATIPPLTSTGGFINFAVSESFSTVETVVVFINIALSPTLQCNQVELTSPSGTKSILVHAANGFANTATVDSRILSNAFYGEPVNGTWKLSFFDFCGLATPTQLSTVRSQALIFAGH